MTKDDVIALLVARFCSNFAQDTTPIIIQTDSVGVIYDLVLGNGVDQLSKSEQANVLFRSAYILETIYFYYREQFMPYRERFVNDFNQISSQSARRHAAKIMAHLLKGEKLTPQQYDRVAETCAAWIVEPKTKVAVKIWCFEVLLLLKERVEWVGDVLPELMILFEMKSTPGIECRLRKWRNLC